ncbi:MRJP-domain-containing protein [Patellaria atrata CBS 101060]|uniref:MRJP-domain-containing protein n=1 Tax=Patellaria atrata CBS 101060 TaxID=1346257 RepID=A0A9P4VU81_9PEZI|nr:MRJP-domain-containing protein [Patellaria atrata CBS 101060]
MTLKMLSSAQIAIVGLLASAISIGGQGLITDPGVAGLPLEIAHLYYDQSPTGIAVSSTGRIFSNYLAGLDANNTNNGSNGKYQVAEFTSNNTEKPCQGSLHLIGVQSVVIDSLDRLWILDTGRAQTENGTQATASYGGPKLIGVNLEDDTIIKTIVFPPSVAYADSYLNDIRFDLRANVTSSGGGIAYITDSSAQHSGIIIVDLGTGESWRHLGGAMAVQPEEKFVPFVWGQPLYRVPGSEQPLSYVNFGSDGIALLTDGENLFFSPVASRYIYSVPTARLRAKDKTSEVLAQAAIQRWNQKGVSDGLETDTNGYIYAGNVEQNAVVFFNPANGTTTLFVRDPRTNWVDMFSVATDRYIYFTVNQLHMSKSYYPGTDRRVKPCAAFRALLPDGGTKVNLS